MKRILLLAGAASLAVSAPLIAQGHGQGRGGDRGQAAERSHGGGQHDAQRGSGRAERGNRGQRVEARNVQREARRDPRVMRSDRSADVRQLRRDQGRAAAQVRREERHVVRIDRDHRQPRQLERQERRQLRENRREAQVRQVVREERRDLRRLARDDRRDRRFVSTSPLRILPGDDRRRFREGRDFRPMVVGARRGCPPGLARQNAWCLPPGQLRHLQAAAYNVPLRYQYRFADSEDHFYRYDDVGTVYRYDRGDGLIDGVYPLYASDLLIGAPMPIGYEVYNVPLNYRPYYADSGDWLYRYDDGAIYRIDEDNGMIDSIVALLTGGVGGLGGLGIGDRLPAGYDVYNVPLDYRDDYADGDDAWYRYADGSIYQVDPQTQLIEQVISLIA